MRKPSYLNFDNNNYYWKKDIDYRANPELYKVGKGEITASNIKKYYSALQPKLRLQLIAFKQNREEIT